MKSNLTTGPGIFDEIPAIGSDAYVVTDNPYEVQALLYKYGMSQAMTLPDMYEMVQRLKKDKPAFEKEFLALHPDKDRLVKLFSKPDKAPHFSLCNLCKSNFTESEMNEYRTKWTKATDAELRAEFQRLNAALLQLTSQINIVPDPDKMEAIARLNAQIAIISAIMTAKSTELTPAQKEKSTNKLMQYIENMSTAEKTIGLLCVATLVGLGATWALPKIGGKK